MHQQPEEQPRNLLKSSLPVVKTRANWPPRSPRRMRFLSLTSTTMPVSQHFSIVGTCHTQSLCYALAGRSYTARNECLILVGVVIIDDHPEVTTDDPQSSANDDGFTEVVSRKQQKRLQDEEKRKKEEQTTQVRKVVVFAVNSKN